MHWPNQIGKSVEVDGKTPTDQAPYRLVKNEGDAYAFYFAKLEFGFGKGLEIQVYEAKQDSKKRLVGVKWMAGNSFGLTSEGRARTASDPLSMNWQVVREAFYPTRAIALGGIKGQVVRINKKSTKPIRPLEPEQVEAWLEGDDKVLPSRAGNWPQERSQSPVLETFHWHIS